MSDSGEPDAAGSSGFSTSSGGLFGRRTTTNVFPAEIKIPGLQEAAKGISDLTGQLQGLSKTLQDLSNSQTTLTSGLNNMLKGIQQNATAATGAVQGLSQATAGGGRPGGWSLTGALGSAINSDLFKDIAMFPLRFIQSTLSENRNLAMGAGSALGGMQFATGMSSTSLLKYLGGMPGSVLGSPEDIMNLMAIARSSGAMASPVRVMSGQAQAGRAPGFFEAVQQAQMMTPGTPVAQIAGTIGGFAAGPGQQQAAFLTGGAFAMLAPGGGMKSLSQWAEGILRWLEGQRPGNKRGQHFTYGELLSQYFPGSNIDAWLAVNGVPPDMREYWWTYSLGKAVRSTGGTGGPELDFQALAKRPEIESNLVYQRLQSTSALTRTGFGLGSQMAGAYANKEVSNRWFNEIMGQAIQDLLPSKISGGPLAAFQFMPDTMEQLLMTMLERGGTLGALLGGYLGWGPEAITGGANMAATFLSPGGILGGLPITPSPEILAAYAASTGWGTGGGDVGDVAGWGAMGGSTTAGLHPDLRRKLNAMKRANPDISITSGLRNTVQQQNLKKAGHSRVSGKPSAHTRGLAADLGPPSQYNWIAANAGKFGLKSGIGVGEPWHVGLGDDEPAVGLGTLFSLLTGTATNEETVTSIGKLIPGLMNLFFGFFSGGGATSAATRTFLPFTPGLYDQFRKVTPLTFGGQLAPTGAGFLSSLSTIGNIDTTGGGPAPAGAVSARDIYDYLRAAGVSEASAAGILANIQHESGFDPTNASGDGGTSGGLFQHHAGRWAALKNYAASTNRQWTDWHAQVDYALIEARTQYGINLQHTDPAAAAREWTFDFEVPSNATARAAERAADAAQYMFGDVPEPSLDYALSTPTRPTQSQNVVFNNTFVIGGGGGGGSGGVDMRRAVSAVADHLEEEMRRRLARQN